MTTLTYPVNSIMAYNDTDGVVVGFTTSEALANWSGDKFYLLSEGSGATAGIRQFEIDPGGDETLQKARLTIGVTRISTPALISTDGTKLYIQASATSNSVILGQINAADLTLITTFGFTSTSSTPSTSTRIAAPFTMAPLDDGIITGSISGEQEVCLLPVGFGINFPLGFVNTTGGISSAFVGPGGEGEGWSLGLPFRNNVDEGALNENPVKVWEVTGSLTEIGSFSPPDVDPTWTKFISVYGIAYDRTYGHIIVGVSTNEIGPTETHYIIKISTENGAVLWAVPVGAVSVRENGYIQSRIANGVFHYVSIGDTVFHINTLDGTFTSETFDGLSGVGVQTSDDVTNSIICYCDFTAGTNQPAYKGTYMDTEGNHSFTNKFARIWFATSGSGTPRRYVASLGVIGRLD